jgi:hypothetical protein
MREFDKLLLRQKDPLSAQRVADSLAVRPHNRPAKPSGPELPGGIFIGIRLVSFQMPTSRTPPRARSLRGIESLRSLRSGLNKILNKTMLILSWLSYHSGRKGNPTNDHRRFF